MLYYKIKLKVKFSIKSLAITFDSINFSMSNQARIKM